jgi:hypothetical protein
MENWTSEEEVKGKNYTRIILIRLVETCKPVLLPSQAFSKGVEDNLKGVRDNLHAQPSGETACL